MLKCYFDRHRQNAAFFHRGRQALGLPLVILCLLGAGYSFFASISDTPAPASAFAVAVLTSAFVYALTAFLEMNAPDGPKKGGLGLLVLRLNPGYGWLASLYRLALGARTRHQRWPGALRRRVETRRGDLIFVLYIKPTDSTSPFEYSVSLATPGAPDGMKTLIRGAVDLRGNMDFPDEIAPEVDRKAFRKLGREILSLARTFFDDGSDSIEKSSLRLRHSIEKMKCTGPDASDMKDLMSLLVRFHGALDDATKTNMRFAAPRDVIGEFRRHIERGARTPAQTAGLFEFIFRRGISIVETHMLIASQGDRDTSPEVDAAMEIICRLVGDELEAKSREDEATLRLEAHVFSEAVCGGPVITI